MADETIHESNAYGWPHSRPVKITNNICQTVFWFAFLIEIGIAIFGGAHVNIYHVIPAGYVPIHAIGGRYSPGYVAYVSPWVAHLHYWSIRALYTSGIPLAVIAIAKKIAKARKHGTDRKTQA